MTSGGLVAVHAHPDDETLTTGALLATWAAAGRPVAVVTCTRGERGEVIGAELAHLEGDGPALAEHRERELAGALTALGVREHGFLDALGGPPARRFEDSGMAWVGAGRAGRADEVPPGAFVGVDLDEAAERLARVLRARRPEVVATYEPGGGYGHPDHVRTHEVTQRAVELAGVRPDEASPAFAVPVVLWAVQGRSALRRGLRDLGGGAVLAALGSSRAGLQLPDPEAELPSVAVPDDQLDLAVDVLPVRDRVLAALRAHATQVQAVRAIDHQPGLVACYALSNRILAPVLAAETYRRVTGSAEAVVWPAGVRPVA
ncbi:N-acetyl-1-D-myo-inositol-2-amino-2-deoxy-alpha-D-glucopyranoside deacetylase [Cellulomonas fengjieae]|uniref:N-acetyl-1-D-myo-inositol-2-amino-2-deoxy-alpha-D-glucopyranoside deacetylase n=1 Tax=Cellulomonas fengjieae TaxID=2819978 RepID=A0ABS3SL45_9CELL|nr:N-acetyl-1-D-myo-inositol-2-amino-2-deoxy-alpha-D-glucopyranoside deacetylase [Cellulomonas fengjieae]MBO3086458.1 N-acetyl-1-D-myo-inositol-2-amino-2-deoxy-alpha-D-glucopyranoside deacetylase [Cellulomonas fengjieae]QVI66678.1 N-acetyl-1-D-myo-inositol-2-amino-2-deoxy-alpha-D-glucopyranoside deacetylase [Cellulomonas fengjieae]